MPRPNYAQIQSDLEGLSPDQQRQYMDELERRWPSPQGPDLKAGDEFVRGVVKTLNPVSIVSGIAGAIASPRETYRQQSAAMQEQRDKAAAELQAGNYPEAAGHGLAGVLPLIGPASANVGERIAAGDNAPEAFGEGVGSVLAVGMPGALVRSPRVAAGLANKVIRPFDAAPEVTAAIRRSGAGVDMPAGAVSQSRIVPTLEAFAMKGFGGSEASARYLGAASELTSRAQHLVARASKVADNSARGAEIASGFKSFRDAWIRIKGQLYEDATIPRDATMAPQATVDLLDKLIAGKRAAARVMGGAEDLSFYERLRNGLAAGQQPASGGLTRPTGVPLRSIQAAIRELDAKIGGAHADAWSAANVQALKKIAATLDDEFKGALKQTAPDAYAKLMKANETYKGGLQMIDSAFGDTIMKLADAGQYDKIARAVANARMSVDDIPRLFQASGPGGADAIRSSVLADIVAKGTKDGVLTPQGLLKGIETWNRQAPGALETMLTKEQLVTLKDLSTMTRSLEKGLKSAEGSQTMFGARLGVIGTTALVKPLLAIKMLLGGVAYDRFIGSALGQRWLKGEIRPFTPALPSAKATAAAGATGYLTGASAPKVISPFPDMQPQPATR